MAKLNATQLADKWARRMTAAAPDIASGVDRTTKDPGALAAAAKPLWIAKVTDPKTQDSWARNVAAVGASNWKSAMKEKGIPRIQAGVNRAQTTKIGRFQALLSAVDAAAADAHALPRGTLENNIARSAAFQRSMAARAPKRTGA